MFLYRKSKGLRVRRAAAPEPPFWYATLVTPYSGRRGSPVAIDYPDQSASWSPRTEVTVCVNVNDELDRSRELADPLLIEAAGAAERIFRRGEEALRFFAGEGRAVTLLVTADGALPAATHEESLVAVAAWPFQSERLEEFFAQARERRLQWGVVVPIVYPVTTELEALARLTRAAADAGARFLAPVTIEADATARQALAAALEIGADDDRYAMLFHSDAMPVQLATERHLSALAAEHRMHDFVPPPSWDERSNWNAATLLTLLATRMIALEIDLRLAGILARDARTVAGLAKPLQRIGEVASLAIVESLDQATVSILTDWLEQRESPFVRSVNEQWRLRRDRGA